MNAYRYFQGVMRRLQDSPLATRLIKGAAWSIGGALCSRGLLFLGLAVVARRLGTDGFGRLAMVQSTIDVFTVFAGFGLGLASTRSAAMFAEAAPERVGRVMSISCVMAFIAGTSFGLLLFLAAPLLSARLLGDPGFAPLMRLGCIPLFIAAMNSAQTGALVGLQAFRAVAVANALGGIFQFAFMIVGVWLGGLYGVVWGMVAGWAAIWFFYNQALRRELARFSITFSLQGWRKELPELWRFSVPTVLSDAISLPAIWISRSLLANQPGGFAELGLFNAGYQLTTLLGQGVAVLGAPLLPMLASAKPQGHSSKIASVNILLYWGVGTLLILPLLGVPEVLGTVFGARFSGDPSRKVFIILLITTWITSYKRGLANALVTDGRMWWSFLSNAIWGGLLLGVLALAPNKNALVLAIGLLFSYIINILIFMPIYMKTGFVPRQTLLSLPALVIWLGVFAVAICGFIGIALWARIGSLLGVGMIILYCFYVIWQKSLALQQARDNA
jgi:O-antigen/teichoic acid export membrane protein